jgi:nucleotide-binding universal stress UspA family protein
MKIVLAVDGSECSEAATQAVIAQFRPDNTEVQVCHADEWPRDLPASLAFSEGPAAASHVLAVHDQRRYEAEALVAGAARQLRAAGFRTCTTIKEGEPQHTILDCAQTWHADLIVLGSHGRKGLDRFVLGSVSEAVARHAPCSVEIVRSAPR